MHKAPFAHHPHGSVYPYPPLAISSSFTISSPFQPLLRPVVADRGVSLARSLASISARMYRKIYTGLRGATRKGGRARVAGVGDGGGGQVFEKGEPRHISLQTNNFWIFISCFSLPACEPVSKANATFTTECLMFLEIHWTRTIEIWWF